MLRASLSETSGSLAPRTKAVMMNNPFIKVSLLVRFDRSLSAFSRPTERHPCLLYVDFHAEGFEASHPLAFLEL